MKAVLTICSINYMAKALALAESVVRTSANTDMVLLVVDRKDPKTEAKIFDALPSIKVLWVEDLPIPNLNSHAFAFDVIEFNTNVKPDALLFLFEAMGYQQVIYLDPDIFVYDNLSIVFDELENHDLLLTPHYTQPVIEKSPNDIDLLKFGPYNLGFVAVRNTPEACRFLRWWGDRCLEWGYYDPTVGLAVDQKWMTLANCFCDRVKVIKHQGCNVAFWNLHERQVASAQNKWWINETTPLVFVHFSSFDPNIEGHIANKQTRFATGERPDFAAVAKPYRTMVLGFLEKFPDDVVYSFDYFEDQAYITPVLRRFYGALRDTQFKRTQNPFAGGGTVKDFAKTQGLLSRSNKNQARIGAKNVAGFQSVFPALRGIARFVLFVIGPERYFLLTKAFGFFSSLQQHALLMHPQTKRDDG